MILTEVEKKLYSRIAIILGGILLIALSYWGILKIVDNFTEKKVLEKKELIQKYQSKIDSINGVNTILLSRIVLLNKEADSLGKLKKIIYIEYEKKVNAINDASAINHAEWMDTIIIDLNNSAGHSN